MRDGCGSPVASFEIEIRLTSTELLQLGVAHLVVPDCRLVLDVVCHPPYGAVIFQAMVCGSPRIST